MIFRFGFVSADFHGSDLKCLPDTRLAPAAVKQSHAHVRHGSCLPGAPKNAHILYHGYERFFHARTEFSLQVSLRDEMERHLQDIDKALFLCA